MNNQYQAPFWLLNSEYRTYNIQLAHFLGSINAAIFLSYLADRAKYLLENDKITNDQKYGDGWVYLTIDDVEAKTAMTRWEQDPVIKKLINCGMIEKAIFGLPSKRYFRLNRQVINSAMGITESQVQENSARLCKKHNLGCGKSTTYGVEKAQPAHNIEEPKDKPNNNTSEGAGAPVSTDVETILSLFIKSIQITKPDIKLPSSTVKWSQSIDRMLRIDKRSVSEIKEIIEWLPTDDFWCTNILSASTLRRQYDKLVLSKNKSKEIYGQSRAKSRDDTKKNGIRVPAWMDKGT